MTDMSQNNSDLLNYDLRDPAPLTEGPKPDDEVINAKSARGLIIMLHGYDEFSANDPGADFQPAVEKMRRYFEQRNYIFRAWKYYSKDSFKVVARRIRGYILGANLPTHNLHMFGYSMGGLVARQIAADGIDPQSITTFCTPNLGIMGHIPTPNDGALSMHPWSDDLKRLNKNANDLRLRDRYHMIGLSYNSDRGDHYDDDGMVTVNSANMYHENVQPGEWSHWLSIRNPATYMAPLEVHGGAQKLDEISRALKAFRLSVEG